MTRRTTRHDASGALRDAILVAAGYLLLGAIWILGSDRFLAWLVSDPGMRDQWQTAKGWFYVLVTAVLLFLALYQLLRRDARWQRQRELDHESLRALSVFRESIIDNASIWLNVLDHQARIMVWNKAAEQISGYTRDEVVGGRGIWERLYPDAEYCRGVLDKTMATLDTGAEMEDFDTRIRCKDGTYKVIVWNSRRFVSADGDVGSIAIGQDVTEVRRMQHELEKRATHDSLTGLMLRSRFERLATEELARCQSEGRPYALGWLDVDGFKSVNDCHGHQVGDEVLAGVGLVVRERIAGKGMAARYGGDEMVLLLPGLKLADALNEAEILCRKVREARLLARASVQGALTVSIGMVWDDHPDTPLRKLLGEADACMYEAKHGGRDQVKFKCLDEQGEST